MTTVMSQGSMFDKMLGDIKPNKGDLYQFNVRVGVIKYRPPRHSFFEFIQYMENLILGRFYIMKNLTQQVFLLLYFLKHI